MMQSPGPALAAGSTALGVSKRDRSGLNQSGIMDLGAWVTSETGASDFLVLAIFVFVLLAVLLVDA